MADDAGRHISPEGLATLKAELRELERRPSALPLPPWERERGPLALV
jgi:hypothetical protein